MGRIADLFGLKKSLGLSLGGRNFETRAAQNGAAEIMGLSDRNYVPGLLSENLFDALGGPKQLRRSDPSDSNFSQELQSARDVISTKCTSTAWALEQGAAHLAGEFADTKDAGAESESRLEEPSGSFAAASSGYSALGIPASSLGSAASPNASPPAQKAPLELLVQFTPGANAARMKPAADSLGGMVETLHTSVMAEAGPSAIARMTFGQDLSLERALEIAGKLPGVTLAEPNWGVEVQAISDDPYFTGGNMWGMYSDKSVIKNTFGSRAFDAWESGYTGSSSNGAPSKTVIGVIDTGIDYTHPDLYLNIWINQLEISLSFRSIVDFDGDSQVTFRDLNKKDSTGAFLSVKGGYVVDANSNDRIDAFDLLTKSVLTDGQDTDGNGRIDDLIGWDFVNNDNNPFDDNGHGTHVAGTIGASGGNGTGVVGVAWDVQIMALKTLSASGSGSTSAATQAVDYYTAASKAANLAGLSQNYVATNNSWGGGGYSDLLLNSIVAAAKQDILFIAAAGNGGSDGIGDDNDLTPRYPSSYNTTAAAGYDAVIAVASLTSSGALSSFSNWGETSVELAAPGSSVWSSLPSGTDAALANSGKYGSYSGTSMATPHVTGAIALYASLFSNASAAEIREALLTSTVATASLTSKTLSGGRLDVGTFLGTGRIVDTTAPVVSSVAYGSTDGTLRAGETVALLVALNEAVVVDILAGMPTLSLNAGSTQATYMASSSTPTTLVFSYTVQPGDSTADLAVTGFNLNGATIRDATGSAANLSGAVTSPSGILAIDTSAPTVTVSAAKSALAPGETTLVTFQFSEQVSGFESTDITVVGGQIARLQPGTSTTSYIVEFTAGQQGGSYSVGVASTGSNPAPYTDIAGNAGGSGNVRGSIGATGPFDVYGTNGSDAKIWSGRAGVDEVISGLAKGSTSLGAKTIDTLVGNGGNDVFVFSDSRGHYYDDGDRSSAGISDYGIIDDFAAGDQIQFHSTASRYLASNLNLNGVFGTGIYVDTNGSSRLDDQDELIGIVEDVLASSVLLTSSVEFDYTASDLLT